MSSRRAIFTRSNPCFIFTESPWPEFIFWKLAPEYGFNEVAELIKIYSSTSEKKCLDKASASQFVARWPELEKKLQNALCNSCVPEVPDNENACSDLLIEIRLKYIWNMKVIIDPSKQQSLKQGRHHWINRSILSCGISAGDCLAYRGS